MSFAPHAPSDPDWDDLTVTDDDLHFITNLLLEREAPLTTQEMLRALIERRMAARHEGPPPLPQDDSPAYHPTERYAVGATLRFPTLGHRVARVVARRDGENPELPSFEVIQVEFEGDGSRREFAVGLADHKLNRPAPPPLAPARQETPEAVLAHSGRRLEERLHEKLSHAKDLVRIAGRWFPRALLAEIHDGHRNLAEAVLDVSQGGPLPTRQLLEHVELPPDMDPLLAEFSLDYALQEDERFDEVGPAGQVLWYLRRLEPPEVLLTPPRLEYEDIPHDRAALSPPARQLEAQLDDELSPLESPDPPLDEVTLSLLFPHWRVGALPLSSRLRPLFPTAYESPRIRFILVDGHTGQKFPGWVVRGPRYVVGLEEWFQRHQVPAGGLVRVRRGEEKGEVVVEAIDRRRRNEWIRTITVDESGRIGFTMSKVAVGAAYDERMVVGLTDATALDQAWLSGHQRRASFERLVVQIFRELAKLNPQTAVHAQALYSGVNVVRRVPPAPLLLELIQRPYFEHVGDLYWRFEESAWGRG